MGYVPPWLNVRRVAPWDYVSSCSSTAGDGLRIYGNLTDILPRFQIAGNGSMEAVTTNGGVFRVTDGTGTYIIDYLLSGTDAILESKTNNNNLYLKTNGTGKLKFGTYTAGIKADSIGYIEVLDSGGTSRRLMVQSA